MVDYLNEILCYFQGNLDMYSGGKPAIQRTDEETSDNQDGSAGYCAAFTFQNCTVIYENLKYGV